MSSGFSRRVLVGGQAQPLREALFWSPRLLSFNWTAGPGPADRNPSTGALARGCREPMKSKPK